MPFYRFWALNEHKQTISGMMIGSSADNIHKTLQQFNQRPLKVQRLLHLSFTRFTDIDRFEVCHALSELLKAGVTLVEALTALALDQRDIKRRILYSTFAQSMRFGCGMRSFKQNDFFDETAFQTLLHAEQTGNLGVIFATLADYYRTRHDYRSEIHRIIRYPVFLAITLLILIVILSTLVLPNLETLMPTTERGIAYTSFRWFSGNLDLIAILFIGFIVVMILCKPLVYRVPIVGRAQMGQFWNGLSFCLQQGIPLIESLALAEKTVPRFFQKDISSARMLLLNGASLSEAFQKLPAHTQTRSSLITLAQKTGDISGMIYHLAKMESRYINNLIKKLLSWTQPLLVLIMGLVVLWILQATIVPLYDSLAEFKD
ncbi:MAG: type II secretion system F family protein [Pseudomonadota bacterium]